MDLHGNWPRIIHEGAGADHEAESGGLKYKEINKSARFWQLKTTGSVIERK
jgi:hypothetical protein